MSLDRLAPDQRAVIQLVLQQGRSYEDLSGLLGISEDAVRERARAGLAVLAGGGAPPEAGEIADFLLGQQTVSQREETRALLSGSPAAAIWARAAADELRDVAGDDLPEIPAPGAVGSETSPAPVSTEDFFDDEDEDEDDADDTLSIASANEALGRPAPRPRPLREETSRRVARPTTPRAERPASSKLGGVLLIGGIAAVVAVLLIVLINGGDDASDEKPATATATATASGTPQALGQIPLSGVSSKRANGAMTLYFQPEGGLVFTLQGERVPASKANETYGVWLIGKGKKPRKLGFTEPVGKDGKLGTSGPREQDLKQFSEWVTQYEKVVVSRESVEDANAPGPIVLQGTLPGGAQQTGG